MELSVYKTGSREFADAEARENAALIEQASTYSSSVGKSIFGSGAFLVVVQFELKRRRRSLISAQGLERSDNLGFSASIKAQTLKALDLCGANPYRVESMVVGSVPGLSLRSNHWAELANAFGVIAPYSNCTPTTRSYP